MYNGILNGSILKFMAKVTVPAVGNPFVALRFTDKISEGMRYIDGSTEGISPVVDMAQVEYRLASEPDEDVNYTLVEDQNVSVVYNPIPTAPETTTNLVVTISDPEITDPDEDVVVRVTLYAQVTDVDKAITGVDPNTTLSNTSVFEMLDGNGNVIGSGQNGDISVPIRKYELYVFGVSVTMAKEANIPVPGGLTYFFGALTGASNDNLIYEIIIRKNENFDFNLGDPATGYPGVTVTAGRPPEASLIPRTVSVDPDTGDVIIEIDHVDEMDNELVYINIPATSNSNLPLDDAEKQFVFGDGRVKNSANITLTSASQYNIEIKFTGADKSLTGGTKILVG